MSVPARLFERTALKVQSPRFLKNHWNYWLLLSVTPFLNSAHFQMQLCQASKLTEVWEWKQCFFILAGCKKGGEYTGIRWWCIWLLPQWRLLKLWPKDGTHLQSAPLFIGSFHTITNMVLFLASPIPLSETCINEDIPSLSCKEEEDWHL